MEQWNCGMMGLENQNEYKLTSNRYNGMCSGAKNSEKGEYAMKTSLKPGLTHTFQFKVPESKTVPYL